MQDVLELIADLNLSTVGVEPGRSTTIMTDVILKHVDKLLVHLHALNISVGFRARDGVGGQDHWQVEVSAQCCSDHEEWPTEWDKHGTRTSGHHERYPNW
jgi:hypothetical protein